MTITMINTLSFGQYERGTRQEDLQGYTSSWLEFSEASFQGRDQSWHTPGCLVDDYPTWGSMRCYGLYRDYE